MDESLLSVGLDVGTTTTQLIVSRLQVVNRASAFAVPQMQIAERKILYRSPVHFTPLLDESHVDETAIRELITREYENAGIRPENVDTGAIIITGETSRKENAAAVLRALSGFAGDFVAATAGPDLESVLAAKGAGAVAWSEETGKTVLHMDIGGGTSNLALIRKGKIEQTGCMNVGGRLIKQTSQGKLTYVSPVLEGLTDLQPGMYPATGQLEAVGRILATALEMAAGLRPVTSLFQKLYTQESAEPWQIPEEPCVISFSGGVAECIEKKQQPGSFGDIGPELGNAIREGLLCKGAYRLGQETIRATVIGAGSHSAQLSGSTVYYRDMALPLKNLPVANFSFREQEDPNLPQVIAGHVRRADGEIPVLAFPGYPSSSYEQITGLARRIAASQLPRVLVCLEEDMAKALGQKLALLLPDVPCLCIDGVQLTEGSYLDIGKPIGPALPVVVKTLILQK